MSARKVKTDVPISDSGHSLQASDWEDGDSQVNYLKWGHNRPVTIDSQFQLKETILDVGTGDQFVYSPGGVEEILVPGIYKVLLYSRQDYR